ncbi:MAG: N-acetyltransferase [Methanomassiliicoccaceae archaeon]|nr:N-acetyltransferase [Methanomassiliicoccaceae archaeon]
MAADIEHDEEGRRFNLIVDGQAGGYLTYEIYDGCLDIQHTVVSGSLRGQGLGMILLDSAKEYARAKDLRVVPTCSYAKKFIQ